MSRPKRWETPFCAELGEEEVNRLLRHPVLAEIAAYKFPSHTPLSGILRNDARVRKLEPGEIIVGAGDYGSSAFCVLRGKLREFSAEQLSSENLGRLVTHKRNWFEALAQVWQQRRVPEVRKSEKSPTQSNILSDGRRGWLKQASELALQFRAPIYDEGSWFGEFAALGRMAHPVTVVAETRSEVLEVRWQGLREIRAYCSQWRNQRDAQYRGQALKALLQKHQLFRHLNEDALNQVVGQTLFETYGSYDWHGPYKERGANAAAEEPLIAEQDGYADGLILVRSGFARLTNRIGHGERTLTYLGPGSHFGLRELYHTWKTKEEPILRNSLRGLGYVDILRVPTKILESCVFPGLPSELGAPPKKLERPPLAGTASMEWLVDQRFINGNKAMLIDLERCVRCDDCVRACASTHGGNPRFVRHGKTFEQWMVTNACMHCTDPTCLIGCPTGAIHRAEAGGTVLINEKTCIGCATCANSCPYDNIIMVALNDKRGGPVLDPNDRNPILKATKCDLCSGQLGGPACVRACPYDALQRVDFKQWAGDTID